METRLSSIIPFLMSKRLNKLFGFLLLAVFCANIHAFAQESPALDKVTLSPNDRILVLAPHPDDEVLGAGGVIQQAVSMKLPIKIVFLTYGDSNQWSFLLYRRHPVIMPGAVQTMGLVRKDEAIAASSILGVDSQNLIFLGYPDFGTLNIWYEHWNKRPPYRSMLTWVTDVPYQSAFRPGAPFKGEEIVSDIRTVLKDFKPTKIFVSHPSDHNGDHLACYLYTRIALWDEHMEDSVALYPYLIHYLGWPKHKGFKPIYPLTPPDTLSKLNHWREFTLTEEEFAMKKAALQAHKSQYTSAPKYLLSFIRYNELFGDFPAIKLHVNQDSSVFSAHRNVIPTAELPEEFNSKEKTSFIGIEWKFIRWEGDDLIVSIALSKPLAQDVEAFIYIFGYSEKTPFGQMPKISLRLGGDSYNLYDQARRIEQSSIRVKRTANEVTVAVPLKLLGNPDKILTSARTYLGNVPLDSASWIAVELD
jgi:LmbE family N-acetylglucosaminyl deacetylase